MGRVFRRPGAMAGAVIVAASLVAGACSHQTSAVERELQQLRQELAALRAERSERASEPPRSRAAESRDADASRSVAPDLATRARDRARARRTSTSPGGPPAARAPDPGAPPPLPVVKLNPKAGPFEDGREPTIRIGRNGREAPPISRRDPNEPLEYDHIDDQGNLVDRHGRIVYHAGTNSPPIDTRPDDDDYPDDRLYEDPHEAPARKVERHLRAPRILDPEAEAPFEDEPVRPGVVSLDGRAQHAEPRLKQFRIRDPELTSDRDRSVIVDHRPRPRRDDRSARASSDRRGDEPPVNVSRGPGPLPELDSFDRDTDGALPGRDGGGAGAEPVRRIPPKRRTLEPQAEVPEAEAAPEPEEPPAPPPVTPGPEASAEETEPAPGPQKLTRQRAYEGQKQRRVKQRYGRAMKKFWGEEYGAAREIFEEILTRYPDHELADNALYWLAETAYVKGSWHQALAWFQDVILRYPEGNKLPDAMLKSALCYAHLGDTSYALQMLSEVETLFSSAPVAEVARERRMALAGGEDG